MKSKHEKRDKKRSPEFEKIKKTQIVSGFVSLAMVITGLYSSVKGYLTYGALLYIVGLLVTVIGELRCSYYLLLLIAKQGFERRAKRK